MEVWILVLITQLGPNKILYDPYLETRNEQDCIKQSQFVSLRQPEVKTICVKKK